jgi:hypothetical protein
LHCQSALRRTIGALCVSVPVSNSGVAR